MKFHPKKFRERERKSPVGIFRLLQPSFSSGESSNGKFSYTNEVVPSVHKCRIKTMSTAEREEMQSRIRGRASSLSLSLPPDVSSLFLTKKKQDSSLPSETREASLCVFALEQLIDEHLAGSTDIGRDADPSIPELSARTIDGSIGSSRSLCGEAPPRECSSPSWRT